MKQPFDDVRHTYLLHLRHTYDFLLICYFCLFILIFIQDMPFTNGNFKEVLSYIECNVKIHEF